MEIRKGTAVSPGIAIAEAVIVDTVDRHIPRRTIKPGAVALEVRRLGEAFAGAAADLNRLEQQDHDQQQNLRDIFAVHLRFLEDSSFRKRITDCIESEHVTAEYAVTSILREIASHFASVADPYISERAGDIHDIEKRLLGHLLGSGAPDLSRLDHEVVVVARDLTPTQAASMDKRFVKGFATETGGPTSHTAIIARSLGIPAVVALEDITELVASQATVIIDGNGGVVILDPDAETVRCYTEQAGALRRLEDRFASVRDEPAVTLDGAAVTVLGNIEYPEDAALVREKGGEGIGLYRTEFLYLGGGGEPREEDHYRAYAEAVRCFPGRPVVIRTVDLGADKLPAEHRHAPEANPALGLRSLRYCLLHLDMFKTQLRAILRVSALGDVRLMFPLITSLLELRQARMILRDVMEDLDEAGIPYNPAMPVGAMVETPSAALTAALLAPECGFFSIGTNDLVQYTLAADRGNEHVSGLYTAADPAVLTLIRGVIHDARRAKIEVAVCGEMASEPEFTMLLLGMGVRTLSLSPAMIPEIKQIIRSVSIEQCNQLARKVAAMDSQRQIKNFLRDATCAILPEAY